MSSSNNQPEQGEFLCGGWGPVNPADERSQEILDSVQSEVCQSIGVYDTHLTVINYTSQVVAGFNFNIHAQHPSGKEVRVKVFVPLPYTNLPPEVCEVEQLS